MIEVISVNENQQIEYHKYRAATCHVAHSQTFAETTKVQGINKLDIDSFLFEVLHRLAFSFIHTTICIGVCMWPDNLKQ